MELSFADNIADPNDYLPPAPQTDVVLSTPAAGAGTSLVPSPIDMQSRVDHVAAYLEARGFVFEPWQVAAFITAVRTKPFVILAGISGTGKTKLPRLVAEATGAESLTIPVRPDWTDSSELLGFERLNGEFQPGALLTFAQQALAEPERQFFFVLDEMNIARVEYYLAEVLSRLEERHPDASGRIVSEPLIRQSHGMSEWLSVRLPDNLCIVGSVNMDETTFGFSRKVLDRAFVIEFSSVDLSVIGIASGEPVLPDPWSSSDWRPAALSLASHPSRESSLVEQTVETLTHINEVLEQGQLQFGYRTRDEIVMFCLAAQQCPESFITTSMGTVNPLDLAIAMKVLPRIQGGGVIIRKVLEGLKAWATPTRGPTADSSPEGETIGFPFCADRIELMLRRLSDAGFTSYWL